jgi:hypothetical protein
LASLPPFCIGLCSKPFSLQSLCNQSSWILGKTDNIFMTRDRNYTQQYTSPRTRNEIITNQTTPVSELFIYNFCSLFLVLCLFKSVTHVCTLKMDKDKLSARSASSLACLLSLLSPCLFIWRLGVGGRTWQMEISGVWALCPKLWFQLETLKVDVFIGFHYELCYIIFKLYISRVCKPCYLSMGLLLESILDYHQITIFSLFSS